MYQLYALFFLHRAQHYHHSLTKAEIIVNGRGFYTTTNRPILSFMQDCEVSIFHITTNYRSFQAIISTDSNRLLFCAILQRVPRFQE